MVQVRRPPTQEDINKALEEYGKVFDQLQEYLSLFKRNAERNAAAISSLNTEIVALTKKKDQLEVSLTAREEEWKTSHEKKATQIISDATMEAEKKVQVLFSEKQAEIDTLTSKKGELEKSVTVLAEGYSQKRKSIRESIQSLEVEEASLKDEVMKLTTVRDELRKQINSIKEKVSYLA